MVRLEEAVDEARKGSADAVGAGLVRVLHLPHGDGVGSLSHQRVTLFQRAVVVHIKLSEVRLVRGLNTAG